MKRLLFPIIALALIAGGCIANNDITVYPLWCGDADEATGACKTWVAENRRIYKIDKDNHSVLEWTSDDSSGETIKYTKCAIVDIRQWSCEFDDESGQFGFSSGEYFFGPSFLQTKYVSKREWEALRE
ncbi:MAG: hypothetical protein AAB668_02570 [Patescibacteria group bacterium]